MGDPTHRICATTRLVVTYQFIQGISKLVTVTLNVALHFGVLELVRITWFAKRVWPNILAQSQQGCRSEKWCYRSSTAMGVGDLPTDPKCLGPAQSQNPGPWAMQRRGNQMVLTVGRLVLR